jgi:hypothetical protein
MDAHTRRKDRHRNPSLGAYLPPLYLDRLRRLAGWSRRTDTNELMLVHERHFAGNGCPVQGQPDSQ